MLYNQEDFESTKKKEKGTYWRLVPWDLCVQLSRFRFSLTLLISYILANKGKQKKKIILSYISVVIFFCNKHVQWTRYPNL